MNFESLRQIIQLAESWENSRGESRPWDEAEFTAWLLTRHTDSGDAESEDSNLQNGYLAMLLAFMYKYASYYSRRITKGTPIYSLDDFGVLAGLYPDRKMAKIEAIRLNLLEKSSGTEVLKRMLRASLLEESENPLDKRSRLISLSDLGKKAFEEIIGPIRKMSEVVMGDLDLKEKLMLMHILNKLERFHRPVFDGHSEKELEDLLGIA